jgi:hypothetical protein
MTRLETVTHVALIGVCCLAAALLIEHRFFPASQDDESAEPDPVGQKVVLPGADWNAAPFSVVLQISSTCPYCNASMPFYRRLTAARQSAATKLPLIVASPDAVAVIRKHLEDEQVTVDRVLHSGLQAFAVVTPTVYVVDSKGVVRRAFVGELDAAGEKQLLAIVQTGKV